LFRKHTIINMSSTSPSINELCARLPDEIIHQIANHTTTFETNTTTPMELDTSMDPSIPPADGSSPFLNLPRELRRAIFTYALPLPPKNKLVEPNRKPAQPETTTGVAPVAPVPPVVPVALAASPWGHRVAKTKPKKVKKEVKLPVRDALVLCKSIAAEILIMLYEERTFALNVYEGIRDGGIEFLNSGRQRLQYREHFNFVRFKRFEGPDDPFGFSRVKRLLIRVYPATEADKEHKSSRHDAMHTHFMIRALVDLLKHEGNFGLNRLQIRFVEPQNTVWHPHPWQNTSSFSVRSSSIHGISVVELILRGLLELRQVQTAVCELPPGLYRDNALAAFVDRIQGVMTGKLHPSTMDDEITHKIEGARDMLDNWIHFTMFSTKASRAINPTLRDSDFMDVDNADSFDYYPDQDGFFDLHIHTKKTTQKSAAVNPSPVLRDVYEKRITDALDCEGQAIKPLTFNPKTSSSTKNKRGPARTCSSRRTARRSPLGLSRHGSGGGASSLLGIISIDDDTLTSPDPPLGGNSAPSSRRKNRSFASRKMDTGLRRSERVRDRHAAFDVEMYPLPGGRLL
jgi:hypothetical protein